LENKFLSVPIYQTNGSYAGTIYIGNQILLSGCLKSLFDNHGSQGALDRSFMFSLDEEFDNEKLFLTYANFEIYPEKNKYNKLGLISVEELEALNDISISAPVVELDSDKFHLVIDSAPCLEQATMHFNIIDENMVVQYQSEIIVSDDFYIL